MRIMVREMSLIRGLEAPAKEMSFPHHLALFKDHLCLLLPTISRHFPPFPAKKMSQSLVVSQYGRSSRGPGRVLHAAPRQPGCTVEQTNHEPRSLLARGASQREFRGFHESRGTRHESRLFFESRPFFSVGAQGWRHRKPPSGPLPPPASHCFPVHHCSLLFTIVRYCSPLFAIVRHCSAKKYYPAPVSSQTFLLEANQAHAHGFHETRDTKHGFFSNHGLFPRRQTADARRRQARRLQGGMYEARENEWKGVFLNPETGITTYTESGFGSRPGISHNIPLCVGKIRISPCRPSIVSAHCGNRNLDFMDVSRPSLTFAGPQVAPSGEAKGERGTNRETQPLTRRAAQASPGSEVFTKHETRNTNHGLYVFHESRDTAFIAARPLLRWARSRGMARLRAAIARPARGGVGGEPVSCAPSALLGRPCGERRRRAAPAAASTKSTHAGKGMRSGFRWRTRGTFLLPQVGPCRLTGVWRFGYSDRACALRPAPTLGYGALESGVRNSEVPRGTKARG